MEMIEDQFAKNFDDFAVLAENEHGRYAVPRSSAHRPAASAVIGGKVWEWSTIKFMAAVVGEGDIVHAGAFFGDFLPGLSKALKPAYRLWAFEPNPENFACALRTIDLNGLENVSLLNAGLGEHDEIGTLRVRANGLALGGASRFISKQAPIDNEDLVHIKIARIDDLIPSDRRISIVQLDLEGYEFTALKGGFETINRNRPTVILEKNKPIPDCAELLSSIGYEQVGDVGPNVVFCPAQNRATSLSDIKSLARPARPKRNPPK
jgi:FkbM family methyltransferase